MFGFYGSSELFYNWDFLILVVFYYLQYNCVINVLVVLLENIIY